MDLHELFLDIDPVEVGNIDFSAEAGKIYVRAGDVVPGGVYVCIKGKNGDGHEYIGTAVEKGAAVIVTEDSPPSYCDRYIRVRSTRGAWATLWHNACKRPSGRLDITAVTGTNGKSSVTRLLCSILNAGGARAAEIGTLTGTLTTPDPCDLYPALREMAESGYTHVVMEASSHALALDKLLPIRFGGAVFTNLTLDHTDFHGSMEAYGAAKAKLFGMCEKALVNYDDPGMTALSHGAECPKYTYSMQSDLADFTAHGVDCSKSGYRFDLLERGGLFRIRSPLCGRFHAQNALAAAAMARLMGVGREAVAKGIASVTRIPGRMEKVDLPGEPFTAYIDYAHTPDALRAACTSLRECMEPDEKLTLIFGCGGERDRSKRPVMGKIAAECADRVIITSDNSRGEDPYEIIREIVSGMPDGTDRLVIADRRQAIGYAVRGAGEKDVLLFCGKGHEKYEIDAGGKHPFDEALEIRRALYQ